MLLLAAGGHLASCNYPMIFYLSQQAHLYSTINTSLLLICRLFIFWIDSTHAVPSKGYNTHCIRFHMCYIHSPYFFRLLPGMCDISQRLCRMNKQGVHAQCSTSPPGEARFMGRVGTGIKTRFHMVLLPLHPLVGNCVFLQTSISIRPSTVSIWAN